MVPRASSTVRYGIGDADPDPDDDLDPGPNDRELQYITVVSWMYEGIGARNLCTPCYSYKVILQVIPRLV